MVALLFYYFGLDCGIVELWNCTHFRHPTDGQLRHIDISSNNNLLFVHFELEII